MANIRVDEYLVEKGYLTELEEARRYIMAGKVFINHQKITYAGKMLKEESIKHIKVQEKENKYASRAGYKLEKAAIYWNIEFENKIMLDVGSSTGGFVSYALQNNVKEVYALDVGTNQLQYELRINPKVQVFEQQNFRLLKADFFPIKFDIITMDVSFISAKLLLENVKNNLKENGIFICLIKPQFEAPRNILRENGVIKDPKVHDEVITDIKNACLSHDLEVQEVITSPITGAKGNQEFLAYIKNK